MSESEKNAIKGQLITDWVRCNEELELLRVTTFRRGRSLKEIADAVIDGSPQDALYHVQNSKLEALPALQKELELMVERMELRARLKESMGALGIKL